MDGLSGDQYRIWKNLPGGLARLGTGAVLLFLSELPQKHARNLQARSSGAKGHAAEILQGGGHPQSPGRLSESLDKDAQGRPSLTLPLPKTISLDRLAGSLARILSAAG